MRLSSIVELWDSILFNSYNFFTQIKWVVLDRKKYKKIISKNIVLKDKYKNERCFVVLNGPSIKQHDLSLLCDEYVFGTNFFYKSEVAKNIKMNFLCWQDALFLQSDECIEIKQEIMKDFPQAQLFSNIKGFKGKCEDNTFYTYNRHMPNVLSVSNKMTGIFSGFSTVALYAINVAMYMGFTKIYVLGLDFEPGGFKHFTNLGENTECDNPREMDRKEEVCSEYWAYAKAHFEAYALNKYARKRNCEIINLNLNSYVRAFEFGKYEDVFNAIGE